MTTEGGVRLEDGQVGRSALAAWGRHMGVPEPDPDVVRRRLTAGSLPEVFASTARRYPDAPALDIAGSSVTHGELDQAAARAAGALRRLDVGRGSLVMLVAASGLAEVVAYLGSLRLGAAVVLADPRLTPAEMSRMAGDSGAAYLIGGGDGLARAATAHLGSVGELIGLAPEDRNTAGLLLGDLTEEEAPVTAIDPGSPAILAFTSGTTGRPKATPLTHGNLLASTRGVLWAWRWARGDHLVHALPISHQHGLSGVHASLVAGSRATILPVFDPDVLLDALAGGEATVMFAVPGIYQRLLESAGDRVGELSRLRLATSGSAPLPPDVFSRIEEATGAGPLERYGTTESGLDVSNPIEGPRVAGSVGLPLPGVEIAIAGDTGDVSPPGEPGEVLIRGPQVFPGYSGSPGSDDAFIHDWFRTGDIGVIDPESGYLRLVGRSRDLIISGGMNVYPREVVEVILATPGVTDAEVVGLPSPRWGEEVVAFVSPSVVDPKSVAGRVEAALAPYKRPKRWYLVDVIPRNELGKVDGARLREMAGSSAGWTSPPRDIRFHPGDSED